NFKSAVVRLGLARPLDRDTLLADGRRVIVGVFPIGIETSEYAEIAERAERNSFVQRLRESLDRKKLIIGVDRLDYSKGLAQRIEAFSRFLDTSPAAAGNIV